MIINLLLFIVLAILALWVLGIALTPLYLHARFQDRQAEADIADALAEPPPSPTRRQRPRR
jgi:hypothetical protein